MLLKPEKDKSIQLNMQRVIKTQLAFTCSKSPIETLKQGAKCVQSWQ